MVADPHSFNADPQAHPVLKNKRYGSGFGFLWFCRHHLAYTRGVIRVPPSGICVVSIFHCTAYSSFLTILNFQYLLSVFPMSNGTLNEFF